MKDGGVNGMDAARFRALVSAYGADLSRWPIAERRRAQAFAAESSEAARWLEEARRLDALLDELPPVAPSADLLRSVAEIPLRHSAPAERAGWPFGRVRAWVAILAAAAAAGAFVGVVAPEQGSYDGRDASSAQLDAGFDEISALDWASDLSEELSP